MTTWNAADKAANVSLSSLVAALTSASQGGVRADTSKSSGKWYWEGRVNVSTGSIWQIGWANATESLTNFIGPDKDGCGLQIQTGNIVYNNGAAGADGTASAGQTVCCAFDIGSLLIWFRTGSGQWNGSSSADPATGTGGINLSTMNAGPYFPMFSSNGNTDAVVANFGATAFDYPTPSGFSALDSNSQAYNASVKWVGYSALPAPLAAIDAGKLLGFGSLPPPLTGGNAAKLIAYGILTGAHSLAIGVTESPDTASVALGVLNALAIAVTESPDTAAVSLGGPHSLLVNATEAPDSIYASLGYRITININTEDADTCAVLLENSRAWKECPPPSTEWTICTRTAKLCNGTVGIPYSETIGARDGEGGYSYAIQSGTLPAGIIFNVLSGLISGTPTVAGRYRFTIRVTDSSGAFADQAFQIDVLGGA